ncbi:16S rRNA (uracil1498-N3)-methyltransferase [Raineyella antarctica]|uniref:Ribosomal RNA small subunit methyltransferase E n=1 Tax=Raineyella antarctica TaxID=1577474 RepID=A0A1G6GXM1_9ACTN|nr:16S rRNA (uracil(1498)-N(3))-methyltransferase [Raineyella antarctica]SDB86739.1 16S rRNA (uracil1498-N3)-methyltransferase [Raineyella antarctica]
MTDPVFLTELPTTPAVGDVVPLAGEEGHHAAVVRRIRAGEVVVLSDGAGRGVRGEVVEVSKKGLAVRVDEVLDAPEPPVRWILAQALAKGGHDEQAIDMVTQAGVAEVVPWQSARAIVRWSGDKAAKGAEKWRRTVREAAKQSRRLRVPDVHDVVGTAELALLVAEADAAYVLHESAEVWLADAGVPDHGSVLLVVGPEGGIAPDELDTLVAAGATAVLVSDGVLRASSAGIVGLAQAQALAGR